MKLIPDRLATWARGLIQRETYPSKGDRPLGFLRKHAGIPISYESALTLGALNAGVRVIAETIGVLDWSLFRVDSAGNRTRRRDIGTHSVLSLRANPEMSSQTLRETLVGHAIMRGNGFAEIIPDQAGNVAELWPLPPNPRCFRLDDGRLIFEFNIQGERYPITYDKLFHVKGFSENGVVGYDLISYMAASIGQGIAVEEFASEYFQNGAQFSMVISHPKTLSRDAQERITKDLEELHTGRGRRWRIKVLEEAMKAETLSANAEQAQLVESRRLSVEDIARWLRIPPHKIGALDRATFNNIEHLGIEFIQETILPWGRRIELEGDYKLLPERMRRDHFTKLRMSTLARGDLKSRNDAYRVGRQWGWLTPNHIADMEDMDPISAEDGGDTLIVPLAYRDAKLLVMESEQAIETGVLPGTPQLPPNPPDDNGEEDEDDNTPPNAGAAFRKTLAHACQRVLDREERYVGWKFANDGDLAKALKNQTAWAYGELHPVVADMAEYSGLDDIEAAGVLKRTLDSYGSAHLGLWNEAFARGKKLKGIAEAHAESLTSSLIENLLLLVRTEDGD